MKSDENTAKADADPHYPADYFARVTHQGVDWVATENGWQEVEPGYTPTEYAPRRFDEAEAQDQADKFLVALRCASRPTALAPCRNHRITMGYTRPHWLHRCDRFNEIVNDDGLNDSQKMKELSTLVAGSGIEELAGWSDDLAWAAWTLKNKEPGAVTYGNRLLQCVYDTADEEGIWLGL